MKDISSILFILNPASGKQNVVLRKIHQVLGEKEIEWDAIVTSKSISIEKKLQLFDLTHYDLVCVYGGDGTHHEAATALTQLQAPPIYFLQGGTANFLSHELGVPVDLTKALQLLTSGTLKPKMIDAMLVNEALVLNSVVMGPLTKVNTASSREMKDSLGFLAYAYTFLSSISSISKERVTQFEITIDDKQPVHTSGSGVIILNGKLQSFLEVKMSHRAALDNGLLTVIVIPKLTTATITEAFLTAIRTQSFDDINQIWQCKEVIVTADTKQTVLFDEQPWTEDRVHAVVQPNSIQTLINETSSTQTDSLA